MKRVHRIKQLDELLRHKQGYTIIDLMALLDVGERTIRKDLDLIQQPPYNAKFCQEYRGRERVYRYQDTNFSIELFESDSEIKSKIEEALNVLKGFEHTPQFAWLKMCLIATESGTLSGFKNLMSFENNQYLQGIDYLSALSDAIINKYPIKLTYEPYNSPSKIIYVHPYHLKQYNNRWFLIGQPDGFNVLHNYAIDRIKSIEHLSKPYIESDVDFDEYFDDIIGVSVNAAPIEHITLLIKKDRYPYIRTKPIHWSQKHYKELDTEDEICITLDLIPNNELISNILSFGDDIVVIEPKSIRDKLANKIQYLHNKYKNLEP